MNTFDSTGKQLYQIARNDVDPTRVKVVFSRPDPVLATIALDEVLSGLKGSYRGVKTVVFIPANSSDADSIWKQHHMGNYIYTGILVAQDLSNHPKIYDTDVVTHHNIPDDVRRCVTDCYCRATKLKRADVYLSESIVHLPRIIKEDTVFEDFRYQATTFFTVGDDLPLLDRYGKQRIRGKAFIHPLYSMVLSVRLSIGTVVDILQIRQFLTSARKDFIEFSGHLPRVTIDTLRIDSKLFDEFPRNLNFWPYSDNAVTREEALNIYRQELNRYRSTEKRYE